MIIMSGTENKDGLSEFQVFVYTCLLGCLSAFCLSYFSVHSAIFATCTNNIMN